MFDGEGFARGLERKVRHISGSTILIIGSGGVGSAIAAALAARRPGRLRLYDLQAASSEALAGRLRVHYPAIPIETGSVDPAGADIVINASPLGMNAGDPLPCDVSQIAPHAVVGEVVMKQDRTPFLAAAEARGLAVQPGIDMLFEQIPTYLEFFGFPATSAETLRELAKIRY
jgi:shikimate dehydrogenase